MALEGAVVLSEVVEEGWALEGASLTSREITTTDVREVGVKTT